MEFKNNLNKFLKDSGMSKNGVAKELQISQSQISNWANYGLKRWTKNSKKLDDFINNYYQDNFKIPLEIKKLLQEILLKNSKNEEQILSILIAVNLLKNNGKNDTK